jgi:hypothetical protein
MTDKIKYIDIIVDTKYIETRDPITGEVTEVTIRERWEKIPCYEPEFNIETLVCSPKKNNSNT